MHHIKVRNFRKHVRAIRESNGITVRKEVRKTEAVYTRNGKGKPGDVFLKSIDSKHFKKSTNSENKINPYDSIDWENIFK
jgi:hypothetical protein